MVFKTTSTKAALAGMTLMEFMVASAITSLLGLGVASLLFYSGRSFAAIANYVELDHSSRIALDQMSREIRQANRLTANTATSLTFEDYDGGELSYTYDTSAKTLRRSKNGVVDSNPLLEECDFLQFSIFQRNSVGGTYNQYAAATASTCKLVQLNWICSRKIFGVPKNTESVQSAKIVIRKQ
jgi:type II secretory pathway component PulJ